MRHCSIGALLGLRVILVANIILLTVLGMLFLRSDERPVAFTFAGLAWLAAVVLVSFLRFPDSYGRPPRGKFKKIVADQALDIDMLKELNRGSF